MFNSLWPHGLHLANLPYPSLPPGVCSNHWVMPSNHLIFYCPLLLLPSIFPSIRVFSNESALCSRWLSIGTSASALPMNIQGLFPLGLTGLISLLPKGLLRVSSMQFKNSNFSVSSLLYGPTFTSIHDYKTIALTIWTFVSKVISLLFNGLSRFEIAFLPRNKCLLISWLQSPSAVILEPPK